MYRVLVMLVVFVSPSVECTSVDKYWCWACTAHADSLPYKTSLTFSETSDSPDAPGSKSQKKSSGSIPRGGSCPSTAHHTTLPAVFRPATRPCSSSVRSFRRAVSREQSSASATSPEVTTGPSTLLKTPRTSLSATVSVYRPVSSRSRDMPEGLRSSVKDLLVNALWRTQNYVPCGVQHIDVEARPLGV